MTINRRSQASTAIQQSVNLSIVREVVFEH